MRPDKLPAGGYFGTFGATSNLESTRPRGRKAVPPPTWAWTIFFRPFFDLDFVGFKRVTNRFQTRNKQVGDLAASDPAMVAQIAYQRPRAACN